MENGFSFRLEKDRLLFGRSPAEDNAPFYVPLKQGATRIGKDLGVLTVGAPRPGKVLNIHKNHLIIHAAFDRIEGDLFARSVQPGDRIRMDGMDRRVKKLLCDGGFPSPLRGRIPMVCDAGGIFWIPGIGLCDRARDESSDAVFDMTWEPNTIM